MNVIIEGNNIFKSNVFEQKEECIGVITSAYLDQKNKSDEYEKIATTALDKSEEYLELLYVNKIKERPRTQEDINNELIKKIESQEKTNKELMQAIIGLNARLESGEVDGLKRNNGNSTENGNGQGEIKPSPKNGK